jgi:hypothetical protein
LSAGHHFVPQEKPSTRGKKPHNLRIPMVLGGMYKDFMGKIKRVLPAMGIGFFKMFTYNTQRFGGLRTNGLKFIVFCLFV